MKKLALMIVVMILASTIAAIADTSFDPSQYSVEELSEIQGIISNYLSQNGNNAEDDGKTVLYNENGIYVEYKGILHHSGTSWIINLYVDNQYGEGIRLSLDDVRINRSAISMYNGQANISNDSIYLAEPNYEFIFHSDDVEKYGFSIIETMAFNLNIQTEDREKIDIVPVSLEMYEPIV